MTEILLFLKDVFMILLYAVGILTASFYALFLLGVIVKMLKGLL